MNVVCTHRLPALFPKKRKLSPHLTCIKFLFKSVTDCLESLFSIFFYFRRDLLHLRGAGARTRRKGKDVEPHHFCLLGKSAGLEKILFCLPRKANNHISSEGDMWSDFPCMLHGLQCFFSRVLSVHPLEHGIAPTLKREMEMIADAFVFQDLKKSLIEVLRSKTAHANTWNIASFQDLLKQEGESRRSKELYAPAGELDPRQDNFLCAHLLGSSDPPENILKRKILSLASGDTRRAKGAMIIAAGLDRDGDARSRKSFESIALFFDTKMLEYFCLIFQAACIRKLLLPALKACLCATAKDDELLPFPDGSMGLLATLPLGSPGDGAGVDDDDFALLKILHFLMSCDLEVFPQDRGVEAIHLAAEGAEEVSHVAKSLPEIVWKKQKSHSITRLRPKDEAQRSFLSKLSWHFPQKSAKMLLRFSQNFASYGKRSL